MLPKYNPVDDVPATTQALPPVGENTTSSAQPEAMYVHTQFKSRNWAAEDTCGTAETMQSTARQDVNHISGSCPPSLII